MSRVSEPVEGPDGQTVSQATRQEPASLPFLDSIRGLSALWVVIGHCRAELEGTGRFSPHGPLGWLALINETLAVPVFIVLSGFLLTSPHVDWTWTRWKGPWAFMQRRIKRIYPAYLAALALILIALFTVPYLGPLATVRGQIALPVTWPSVLAHVVMVHNYWPDFFHKIDPPMWSLALEWQIYLAFALVMVPMAKKWNVNGLLAGIVLCSVVTMKIDPTFGALTMAFGLGSVVAWMALKADVLGRWPALRAVVFLLSVASGLLSLTHFVKPIMAQALATAAAAGIIFLLMQYRSVPKEQLPKYVAWLNWRPLVVLGWFSYSLYLIHYPIVSFVSSLTWNNHVPEGPSTIAVMVVAPAVSMFVAYWFAVVFEHRGRPKVA
ncbi:MAG: acyltransferase [Armatimonadetes bacterium]|nr:acyltransferase [Armatimonadota bacterium]